MTHHSTQSPHHVTGMKLSPSPNKQFTSPPAGNSANRLSKDDRKTQWNLNDGKMEDKRKCPYESSDISPFSSPERQCDDDIASADSEGLCSELKRG